MSAFINLDAVSDQLTIDLIEGGTVPAQRDRALAKALSSLSTADQAYVMAHSLGNVLSVLEEVKKANPTARTQIELTTRMLRAAEKEPSNVH